MSILPLSVGLAALVLGSCSSYETDTLATAAENGGATAPESGGGEDASNDGVDPTASAGAGGSSGGGAAGEVGVAGENSGGEADSGGAGGDVSSSVDAGMPTGPDAVCEPITACGGEPTGEWEVASACLPIDGTIDLLPLGLGCANADVSGELMVSGAWSLSSDGSVRDETFTQGEVKLVLQPSCFDVGALVTCGDNLTGPFETWLGLSEVACEEVTNKLGRVNCICYGVVDQQGTMGQLTLEPSGAGNYQTSEGTLTVSDVGQASYSYCVEGSALLVTPTSQEPLNTTSGSIVLLK